MPGTAGTYTRPVHTRPCTLPGHVHYLTGYGTMTGRGQRRQPMTETSPYRPVMYRYIYLLTSYLGLKVVAGGPRLTSASVNLGHGLDYPRPRLSSASIILGLD